MHLAKHAYSLNRDIAWPVGGSLPFARSIEKRYKELGGKVNYRQKFEGKYVDDRIHAICAEPPDETNWALHVFLGVNRDLSNEPSALVMLLYRPWLQRARKNKR